MAISSAADINTQPLATAQLAALYGPQTQQALRRSQYLADALKELSASAQQPIRGGWGELGSKLLASAILQRANNKGQDLLGKAMAADQSAETDSMMAPIRAALGSAPPAPQVQPSVAPDAPPPQAPPPDVPPPPQPDPNAPRGLRNNNPLNLRGTVPWHGMTGTDPDGYAIFDTPLNGVSAADHNLQAYFKHHGLNTVAGIVGRWAPAGADGNAPANYAAHVAGQLGVAPDTPLNMADQAQREKLLTSMAGFENGRPVDLHSLVAPPQQPAPQGQLPPPAQAPQPQPVPPAGVAGAPAAPPQLPHDWPRYRPTQDEVNNVHAMMMNPKYHQQGVLEAQKLRDKMAQPVEGSIQMVNGVPFYISKDPTQPAMVPLGVPPEAMTKHIDGAPGFTPGTAVDQSPVGTRTVVNKPPEGFQASPGGLAPVHGGPADPTRVQAPPAGYQYGAPGGQQPITGGPADPHAPMNVAAAAERIQGAIRPTIDLAREARQDFGNVEAGYKLQNGPGDVAMLKGINQLITRGAVRPNDIDQQLKSDGLAGGIGELTQYLSSQGKLSPETREKVYRAANALYQSSDQQLKAQVLGHRATTDSIYGDGAFDKYVFPTQEAQALGWTPQPAQPAAAPQPAPAPAPAPAGSLDGALAEAVRRGMKLSPAQEARARALGLVR